MIDKDPGWTSHDAVAKIRNLLKIKKVGHAGTLDPFATGVLPLTLGRATRLTNYFLASDKVYRGIIRFGYGTTTYDIDGEPTSEDLRPSLDISKLETIFSRYLGEIQQVPPPYSAKKVKGRPLYSYARKGIDITPPSKTVTIKSLILHGIENCEAEFELTCTAGTYARSLAHDIGREYGCGAHLVRLRRIRSGEFPIEKAVSLYDQTGQFHSGDFFLNHVIPKKDLLHEIPSIVISEGDRTRLIHGMDLNLLTADADAEEYRLTVESGELIALARRVQTFTSPVAQAAHWIRIHPHITFG